MKGEEILLTKAQRKQGERAFDDPRRRMRSIAAAVSGEVRCKHAVNEQGISVWRIERGMGCAVRLVQKSTPVGWVKPLVVDTWVSNMLH